MSDHYHDSLCWAFRLTDNTAASRVRELLTSIPGPINLYSCTVINKVSYECFVTGRLGGKTVGSFLYSQGVVSDTHDPITGLYRRAILNEYLARCDWEERHGFTASRPA